MQWSDVIARPTTKVLRQFAGLCLVFFVGLAAWRAWKGQAGTGTMILAAAGIVIGILGVWRPAAVRFIYTGWMVVAFPIGWTISHVMLALLFYLVFAPVAIVFRVIRRDALRRQRRAVQSYWTTKARPVSADAYFRQS